MAAGKINLQKASGGITAITGVDGIGNTELVLPESGTVATISNIDTSDIVAEKQKLRDLTDMVNGKTVEELTQILNELGGN